MEYRNTGNQIMKNIITVLGFAAVAVLLFTTAAVLLEVIAVAAIAGACIWGIYKFVNFIKSKWHIKGATKHRSNEKLIVEIVTDPEIQSSFTHKNIVDVEYEEV